MRLRVPFNRCSMHQCVHFFTKIESTLICRHKPFWARYYEGGNNKIFCELYLIPIFIPWSVSFPNHVAFLFLHRNGRFLLQSLGNILPPSAVLDSEEALNKGSTTATDVFVSLRTRSILHLFAATGSSLGLKVVSLTCLVIPSPCIFTFQLLEFISTFFFNTENLEHGRFR